MTSPDAEMVQALADELNNVTRACEFARPGWDSYGGTGEYDVERVLDAIGGLVKAIAMLAQLQQVDDPQSCSIPPEKKWTPPPEKTWAPSRDVGPE